tara:strand:- start:460 stop:666 length:207 start_codon:yes stop_codon:yes gene_type:complete
MEVSMATNAELQKEVAQLAARVNTLLQSNSQMRDELHVIKNEQQNLVGQLEQRFKRVQDTFQEFAERM